MQTMNFVAGLTIEQAITRARNLAITSKQPVLADINDVKIQIDANTDIRKALAEYHQKLNEIYEGKTKTYQK